jgi:hypothetical protein
MRRGSVQRFPRERLLPRVRQWQPGRTVRVDFRRRKARRVGLLGSKLVRAIKRHRVALSWSLVWLDTLALAVGVTLVAASVPGPWGRGGGLLGLAAIFSVPSVAYLLFANNQTDSFRPRRPVS